ncbi:MAG: MMPL family transporter [Actinomycetota bacterium]
MRAITRWATRWPKRLLGVVAIVTVLFGVVGTGVTDVLTVGGFVPNDAESNRVAQVLEDDFATGTYGWVLLLEAKEKWVYTDFNRAEGERITTLIEEEPGVLEVASFYNIPEPPPPGLSPLRDFTGHLALIGVKLSGSDDEQRRTAAHLTETYAVDNELFYITATGATEISRVAAEVADEDLTRAELLAAPLTLLGLLMVFRGFRAAIIPLIVAVVAVLGSFAALRVATSFVDISIFARTLVTALGLGLAIDYSMLLVARFREELAEGRNVDMAVSRTLQTAGRTIGFSAATVGASLLGLLVFPVVYLRSFAIAGVAIVAMAALASMLVAPPIMRLFGEGIGVREKTTESFWGRQAGRVLNRPIPWLLGVTLILLVLASPILDINPSRIDERVLPKEEPARIAAERIRTDMSMADVNSVHMYAPGGDWEDPQEIFDFTKEVLSIDGPVRMDSTLGFVRLDNTSPINTLSRHFRSIDDDPADGTWFNIVYRFQPDDERIDDLVRTLRDFDTPWDEGILIGGNDATRIDTVDTVVSRVPWALLVIAVVTFVLLFLFTGSVVMPIKALVLNLLSLTATFGGLVWVFQQGNFAETLGITATGTIDVFTPILMFCITFGLSMDYEVFILARIKEHFDLSGDSDESVRQGLGTTGPIVTAAAMLLAIVFFAIATSGVSIVKMFGLGLAVAVLTDAFLVRATLTPALMKLAGRSNWWAPRPLRRFHLRYGVWETDPVDLPPNARPA